MSPTNNKDFSPLECDPLLSFHKSVSSEAQDGEKPPASQNLSVAALKANLFYAEAKRQQAHAAHAKALIEYAQASEALNQAIVKKNSNG
jgi:hypothetical protein